MDIGLTTIEGGNFKAVLRVTYPCGNIEDIREPNLDPPTFITVIKVIKRHREECTEGCE